MNKHKPLDESSPHRLPHIRRRKVTIYEGLTQKRKDELEPWVKAVEEERTQLHAEWLKKFKGAKPSKKEEGVALNKELREAIENILGGDSEQVRSEVGATFRHRWGNKKIEPSSAP